MARDIVEFDVNSRSRTLLNICVARQKEGLDIVPANTRRGGMLKDGSQCPSVFPPHGPMMSHLDIIINSRRADLMHPRENGRLERERASGKGQEGRGRFAKSVSEEIW